MEIQYQEMKVVTNSETVPNWFGEYTYKVRDEKRDPLTEVSIMEKMTPKQVNEHLGGNFEDLPYEFLDTLFINGSDNDDVAAILRKKREDYVHKHPEKTRGVPDAGKGIITFDGRFIPLSTWVTASDSEKRGVLVGSTCFHYNSDTPGMDSSPEDRF